MEVSNIYKTDMLKACEMFFEKLKNAGITLTVIVLNDWQSYDPALLPVAVPAATNYYAFNTLTQEGLDATRSASMLSPNGTVRHLILSEQGFTSISPANGGECLELQAEAITRAYQAAAANPYVEAFMLNRYVDETSLVAQNYAFGLWSNDPFSSWISDPLERKPSWYAYQAVDAQ